jgi:hypothetical protein
MRKQMRQNTEIYSNGIIDDNLTAGIQSRKKRWFGDLLIKIIKNIPNVFGVWFTDQEI